MTKIKTCEVCGHENVETKLIEGVDACLQCVSEEAWDCGEEHMKNIYKDKEMGGVGCIECAVAAAEAYIE